MAATGTLTRKIARQLIALVSTPPSTGPDASPIPDTPPQIASARRRSWAFGKAWAIRASEQGISQAAPRPCSSREAINIGRETAALQVALPKANTPTPITNPVRAPTRSSRPSRS